MVWSCDLIWNEGFNKLSLTVGLGSVRSMYQRQKHKCKPHLNSLVLAFRLLAGHRAVRRRDRRRAFGSMNRSVKHIRYDCSPHDQ